MSTSNLLLVRWALVAALALLLPPPAGAQTVPIRGRVEDAVSRRPLAGVRVFASDSSRIAITDSRGLFVLRVSPADTISVWAESVGYRTYRFDLPESAPSRLSVLLLEPAPIELEGIDVVSESAVNELIRDLRRRRNAYPGSARAFDRTQLERVAGAGSIWDFVRRRTFYVFECGSSSSGLCTRERGWRGVRQGLARQEIPVLVCIDGRESWGAVAELGSLDVESVSMVELYNHGIGGIRVYTPGYITSIARRGRNIAPPLAFGC